MAIPYEDVDRTIDELVTAIDFANEATEKGGFKIDVTDSVGNKGNIILSNHESNGAGLIVMGPYAYVRNPFTSTHYVSQGIAIGRGAYVQSNRGIAIGYMAGVVPGAVAADNAIQLGQGTNNVANTFKVFDTTILNANGKIPASVIEGGGGGGTSFTPDSTLVLENDILGIDFADDTGSGLTEGKAVRSNEFNTAMNTISSTFGNFVTQLSGKQNAFNVGKGLTLANSVLSADVRRWLFVEELPSSDVDTNAVYLMLNSRVFPSATGYVTATYQKLAVTYDEGVGYRLIRFLTDSDTFYTSSGAKSLVWEMYITDGVTWTKSTESAEGGDKLWCTTMGWTTSQVGAAYTNVVYANTDFRYIAAYKHWNTDNNTTRIDGTLIDTSTLPPYEYMASQHDGTSWQDLGVFDFEQLFAKVEIEIASKADTSALSDYATTSAMNTALATKQNVKSTATLTDNSTVALADNTDYTGADLTTLTFTFPSGNFECYISLTTASSGTPSITFPNTAKWIGDEPTYENSKQYEFSVKNGVIVAGVVE